MAIGFGSFAQDTTRRKTIDITSTFKPVLRDASKINFNAAPPVPDTSKPRMTYNIPSQNLLFKYVPTELKPVALLVDSVTAWQYSNFLKVGFGNVHQPYVKAGLSFGDGANTFFNIFADHYTSKGDLPFQKNSLTSVGAAATYKTRNDHEWNASLGFKSDDYFLYGFQPSTLPYEKNELKQRFQTIEGKINFRNTVPTEFGLTYNPSLRVAVMADNKDPRGSESNATLDLPLTKSFGGTFGFNLGVTADLTNYRREINNKRVTDNNNYYLIKPAITAKSNNFYVHAGIIPSWDNGDFHMLPNVMADVTTNDKKFTLLAGWIGYYNKGSYQRFASINPWLAQPDSMLLNDRVQELYAGIKGSLGDHFTYYGKAGVQQHRNVPLFVNDQVDGKTFLVLYEPRIDIINIHGEVAYTIGEQFTAKGGVTFNSFTRMKQEPKAWGMIPRELNLSLRWRILKDLWFNTELWSWDGAYYRTKTGDPEKGDAAFDFNAGAEFRITKNFNLWLQMNNIFNNKYERWNQYEVFGFNILGGITYSFNQK
jgi:hypothetical protein